MFEIVDDDKPQAMTDGRQTMGILKAHLRAFGSGELKNNTWENSLEVDQNLQQVCPSGHWQFARFIVTKWCETCKQLRS